MSNDNLTQLEGTVTGAATKIGNLVNLATGPTAVVSFVTEGVFKGVRLALDIRRKAREISAQLADSLRARSILRSPIVVDLSQTEFLNFYQNEVNLAAFPVLDEMGPELDEFDATGGLPSEETKAKLKAARFLAPAITNDPELTQPNRQELREMFANRIGAGEQNFRRMVEEYVKLYPEGELTFDGYLNIAEDFWKDRLAIELTAVEKARLDAEVKLKTAVRELVRGAFLGDDGFALKTLGLVKDLRKSSIDKEITTLQLELADASADDKTKIQKRIDDLTAMKGRLGS